MRKAIFSLVWDALFGTWFVVLLWPDMRIVVRTFVIMTLVRIVLLDVDSLLAIGERKLQGELFRERVLAAFAGRQAE